MLRVVLDTNVYIAGLIAPKGSCARILAALGAGVFDAVTCPELLAELNGVLSRDKFRPYVSLEETRSFVDWVSRVSSVRPDVKEPPRVTPDPADDYLVALALTADASLLVTGDDHLLGCTGTGVRIVGVSAFGELIDALALP